MATWLVHPRAVEKILERYKEFYEEKFILGNIAPDSGIEAEMRCGENLRMIGIILISYI